MACSCLSRFQVHYNGYLKPYQEPWAYGADVERICKRFIELRYQLIQLWCAPCNIDCKCQGFHRHEYADWAQNVQPPLHESFPLPPV